MVKFQFWATLLDSFETYLHPDKVYDKYWGSMDNPSISYEEFTKKAEEDLLNTINKVRSVSEPASKGTAFNNLVDICNGFSCEDPNFKFDVKDEFVFCTIDVFRFRFPLGLIQDFAELYRNNALAQVYTDGILHTGFGDVRLYGYIDELLPLSVHDIKTTGGYEVGQFRNHWQHLVYPYCLNYHGDKIKKFSYDILTWKRKSAKGKNAEFIDCIPDSFYRESYIYNPERDIPILEERCCQIIQYIETNRDKITNKKIFNQI